MLYKERITLLRTDYSIIQKEIAKKIGINVSHYANCEREEELFPLKHLITIANIFNVSLDYIFSFTDIKQYENNNKEINFDISSKRLKEFRKENKLTQEKIAKMLNASPSVIVHHETKRHIIATPFLYTICKKYRISADYLLGKIDSPKNF